MHTIFIHIQLDIKGKQLSKPSHNVSHILNLFPVLIMLSSNSTGLFHEAADNEVQLSNESVTSNSAAYFVITGWVGGWGALGMSGLT